jgi:hypothetical protein
MQKMRRGCKKLAQKLTCMDTPWEPDEYEAAIGETSTVRTPPDSGVGTGATNEDNVEYMEEEDYAAGFDIHCYQREQELDFDWPFDEIGTSQLGGAPGATQGDDQVLSSYNCLVCNTVNGTTDTILYKCGLCFHYRVRAVHNTKTILPERKAIATTPTLGSLQT